MSHPRTQALEVAFRTIAQTRMAGVPVLHPGLQVQAVGFELLPDSPWLCGVLVTPWFMNLVRLPAQPLSVPAMLGAGGLPVGVTGARTVGSQNLDFIGAFEPGLGAFEAASLFSPMFDFADQDAAVQTACEVLRLLREPAPVPSATVAPAAAAASVVLPAPGVPSRRGFLLGRSAAPGGR